MNTYFKAINISFQMNGVLQLKDSHRKINSSKTKCTQYFGTHCTSLQFFFSSFSFLLMFLFIICSLSCLKHFFPSLTLSWPCSLLHSFILHALLMRLPNILCLEKPWGTIYISVYSLIEIRNAIIFFISVTS